MKQASFQGILLTFASSALFCGEAVHFTNLWRTPRPGVLRPTTIIPAALSVDKLTPRRQSTLRISFEVCAPRILECIVASEMTTFLSKQFEVEPAATLATINVIVHVCWQGAMAVAESKNDTQFLRWMLHNFLMPLDKTALRRRPHTLILSAFSHMTVDHITGNLSMLKLVGPTVSKALGTRQFSYFYMAAIYASDLFLLWLHRPIQRWLGTVFQVRSSMGTSTHRNSGKRPWWALNRLLPRRPQYSLGASGAIGALFMFSCLYQPKKRLRIGSGDDAIEIPAAAAGWLYFLYDLFQASSPGERIAHGAHLGGYVFGAVIYFFHRISIKWSHMKVEKEKKEAETFRKEWQRKLEDYKRKQREETTSKEVLELKEIQEEMRQCDDVDDDTSDDDFA